MSVTLLCSATGAPGTTTTALALALTWPRDVLLVDGDRDASHCVLAGYLRGIDAGGRGLGGVARVFREAGHVAEEILPQTVPLTRNPQERRRFLPGFTSAGSARLFEHVWGPLGEALAALDGRGIDVIVDAGRITPAGLPLPLLATADAVLVVTRSSLPALAGLRIHAATLIDQVSSLAAAPSVGPALAVVGRGEPYSSAEISAQFGLPCLVQPPWDTRSAAVLSEGVPETRRSGRFLGSVRGEAKSLADRLARAREHAHTVTMARVPA